MTFVTAVTLRLCCPYLSLAKDCLRFHKTLMGLELIRGLGGRFQAFQITNDHRAPVNLQHAFRLKP